MVPNYPQSNSVYGSPSRRAERLKFARWANLVRVAIYVVYLRPMHSTIQHKESNPNSYLPG